MQISRIADFAWILITMVSVFGVDQINEDTAEMNELIDNRLCSKFYENPKSIPKILDTRR